MFNRCHLDQHQSTTHSIPFTLPQLLLWLRFRWQLSLPRPLLLLIPTPRIRTNTARAGADKPWSTPHPITCDRRTLTRSKCFPKLTRKRRTIRMSASFAWIIYTTTRVNGLWLSPSVPTPFTTIAFVPPLTRLGPNAPIAHSRFKPTQRRHPWDNVPVAP